MLCPVCVARLAGTGAFCADHPCGPRVTALLNQGKVISSGYYYDPDGNGTVLSGDHLSVQCNAGFTLVDSPVNKMMICEGGLYSLPAEGQEPTCELGHTKLIFIIAAMVFVFVRQLRHRCWIISHAHARRVTCPTRWCPC